MLLTHLDLLKSVGYLLTLYDAVGVALVIFGLCLCL